MSSRSVKYTVLASVALLIILGSLIWFYPGQENRLPFATGLGLFFGFGMLWYSPHWLVNKLRPVSPARIYFLVGSMLITLGCISSVLYPEMLTKAPAWKPLSEVMLLILGAVVGGSFCSDAILGIEFEGELVRLDVPGALIGCSIVTACLIAATCLHNPESSLPIGWMMGAGFFPLLVVLTLRSTRERSWPSDLPLVTFFCGAALIVLTFLFTKILLEQLTLGTTDPGYFFSYDQSVNIVKNLVPAYCSAIGAGLILRGVQKNTATFSLEDWTRYHFRSWSFQSAGEDRIRFADPAGSQGMPKIVEVIISPTVSKILDEQDGAIRKKYGEAASRWLPSEFKQHTKRGKVVPETLVLKMPNADRLLREFSDSR